MQRNNMVLSRKQIYHIYVAVNSVINIESIAMLAQQSVLCIVALYVSLPTWNTLGFNVKFRIFLSDFNQIWILTTDFHRGHQYQISLKSVYRKSR
jgi:hypothetical protein